MPFAEASGGHQLRRGRQRPKRQSKQYGAKQRQIARKAWQKGVDQQHGSVSASRVPDLPLPARSNTRNPWLILQKPILLRCKKFILQCEKRELI
jgi:hypothetical protein